MAGKIGDKLKQGKDVRFTVISKLDDPDAYGAERVAVTGVSLDDLTLADWEVGKTGSTENPFTYTDYSFLDMRDIKQLNPELQAIIPTFLADCKSKGLIVGIGECYRTVTEQEALYAKGRTTGTKGAIVTNCRGTSYSSPHQWGVAFDFYRNDGKGIFDDRDGWFAKVGAVGKAHGLEWGGDWQGWCDKPHLQLKKFFRDGTTKYLKQTYGTPGKFMATWSNQIADNSVKSDTTCDMKQKRSEYSASPK